MAALRHLDRDARHYPDTHYAYIAPLRNQAERIAWSMLKEMTKDVKNIRTNGTSLIMTYPNGSTISIYGADNPDALRGIGLHGVVLDEYAQMSPIIFSEIITLCVADTQGYIIIIGTPKGKNHFWRVFKAAQKDPDWFCTFKTLNDSLKEETGQVIENLRKSYQDDLKLLANGLKTQAEIDQEWFNSFEAAIKGAVYGNELTKARDDKRITTVAHDPHLLTHTVWDLGIRKGNAMAIGFYQKPSPNEIRLIDYYENIGLGFAHYIKYVKEKPYVYGKHFAPHDIRVKELTTGKTRLFTAEKLGINFEVVPSLSIDDGIDLARAMWSRLWIDEKKGELFVDFMGSYHYEEDEKRGVFKPAPVHDYTSNCADQYRYAAIVEDEMTNEIDKPVKTDRGPAIEDEYVGNVSEDEYDEDGNRMKHPMLRGTKIGLMGHGEAKHE